MKYSNPLRFIADSVKKNITETSHPTMRQIHSELEMMTRQVQAVENLAANRSPHMTQEAHALMVANESKRLEKTLDKSSDRIQEKIRQGYINTHNQRDEILGLKQNAYAQEYRTALRGLSDKKRDRMLKQAIENQDSAFIAAVTQAPAVLSGLKEEIQERTQRQYYEKYAPALTKQLKELEDGISTSVTAVKNARTAAKQGFDPDKMREIAEAEAKHKAAQEELGDLRF